LRQPNEHHRQNHQFTSAVLGPLDTALRSGQLYEEIGRDTVKLIRDNFNSLRPNERGFPTTHFWHRAAEATQYEAGQDAVRISVNQIGVSSVFWAATSILYAQKFLTIPAIAETYGHRAADFGNLKIVRGPFQMYTGRLVSLALVPADWTRDSPRLLVQPAFISGSSATFLRTRTPMSCRPTMKFSTPLYRRLTGSWQTNPEKINHHEFLSRPTPAAMRRPAPVGPAFRKCPRADRAHQGHWERDRSRAGPVK